MQFIDFKTLLYSDTLVPDIFVSEYLPALKGDYVKIYLYCLFLVGKNRGPSVQELAHILDIPQDTVKKGLHFMDNLNILSWTEDGIVLKDLKEIEINRFYRPKSTSSPEEAAERGKLNIRRRQLIEAINDKFFSGVMSPSWYGDIDLWFEQYGFTEDVMMMLFEHCSVHNGLSKPYITKTAENMHARGVVNSYDFDRYVREYDEMKTVSGKISKKLRWPRLNVYQEEIVDKWTRVYGFSFDIIELALQKTKDKPDAAMSFFDKILTDWHNLGLDSVEKILADQARYKAETAAKKRMSTAGPGRGTTPYGPTGRDKRNVGGFTQRAYDGEILNQFVTNEFGGEEAAETKKDN